MSRKAERVLIGLLTEFESLEVIHREGFRPEVMPTEELIPVVEYALHYSATSGKAPTAMVINDRFPDLLADMEVTVDELPEESVEWALAELTFNHSRKKSNEILKSMARAVSGSDPETIFEVLATHSSDLSALVTDMAPQTTRVDMRERGLTIVERHDLMAETGHQIRGMTFGLNEVDEHFGGIHPGEVAIFAGAPKSGKSIWLSYLALKDWERGRSPVLVTLENSIEMTEMRIACQALHLDYRDLERGTLSAEDRGALVEWVHDVLLNADNPLHIIRPPEGQRTASALVQQAYALDCDSVLVDQLTFVEPDRHRKDGSKAYEVAETIRRFKTSVSAGRRPIPLVLAHQVKREGVKAAAQTGRLAMDAAADSSEVERGADMLFGLYASDDQRAANSMSLQALAVRRAELRSYDLHWQVHLGLVGVQHILTEDDL